MVGGIGSVPGAALGGVLIGLFESLWAGYLPSAYREVALFVAAGLDARPAPGRPVRSVAGRRQSDAVAPAG